MKPYSENTVVCIWKPNASNCRLEENNILVMRSNCESFWSAFIDPNWACFFFFLENFTKSGRNMKNQSIKKVFQYKFTIKAVFSVRGIPRSTPNISRRVCSSHDRLLFQIPLLFDKTKVCPWRMISSQLTLWFPLFKPLSTGIP